MSEPPVFSWHEKYRKYYRDFEHEGRWYRQYDDEKGVLIPLAAPAQTTSAQHESVPRSFPAQNPAARDQFSGSRPSVQQTSAPRVTGDPLNARRPSLQPNSSAALQIGLDKHQAAATTNDPPNREPWGMSQGPLEPTRPGQERYALEGGAQKREPSQMRAGFGYPESTAVKGVEAAEGDHPNTVTPHKISHQQQGHGTHHSQTVSGSDRSQSERKMRTSFANPTESEANNLARQLKSVHIDAHAGGGYDSQYPVPQHSQSAQYQYSISDYNSRPQLTSDYSPVDETVANQMNQSQWATPREFSPLNKPVASAGTIQTQRPYHPSPYAADPASGGAHLGHESTGNPTPAPSMDHYASQQQGKAEIFNPASPDATQDLGGRGYRIQRSAGEKELDSRYITRKDASRFFRVGRVFALLWPEAVGSEGTALSQKYQGFTKGRFKQPFYATIRRMVVVKEGKGHCWCLPISTYNNRGTTKPGLDPTSHAIIYMSDSEPHLLDGETGMTKEPLSVDPTKGQKLDELSRVNFEKIYTVEHNLKVMDVGKVSKTSMPKLVGYWEIHRDGK